MAIPVLSDFSFIETGKVRFEGVIEPATDTYIFVDGITNNRLNTPTGILRVLHFKYMLFKDSDNTLLHDNYEAVQIEKINRNGTENKSSMTAGSISGSNLLWNETLQLPFIPQFNFNETTGDLDLFIDHTNGANDYTYDLRLIVDVEYYDYPI
jgi:hypothetical protein